MPWVSVKTDNKRAQALYERHGFVDAGPSPDDPTSGAGAITRPEQRVPGIVIGTAVLAAAYGPVVRWCGGAVVGAKTASRLLRPKEQPPPLDQELIDLLNERDGRVSIVVLDDGRQLQVLDIAWGYDWGDEYAHVLTNTSPEAQGMSLDFFNADRVVAVMGEHGVPLYRR